MGGGASGAISVTGCGHAIRFAQTPAVRSSAQGANAADLSQLN